MMSDATCGLVADASVDPSGLDACRELLATGHCRSIRYFAEIDSTNSAACRELMAPPTAAGLIESADSPSGSPTASAGLPRLFLADSQKAGRGRLGRHWLADDGTLVWTLVVDVNDDPTATVQTASLPLVALAAGVAVARTIEHLAAPLVAKIKWPNDVHVGGGKVAGVLVESVAQRPDRLVIGVGMNVATRHESFAESLNHPARSLRELGRGPTARYEWLPEIVSQLLVTLAELNTDADAVLEELRHRCLLTGTAVSYRLGGEERCGQCLGIDDRGGLLVRGQDRAEDRVDALRSGEVQQIRPK
ncbi:MAG: biotin--[acetyl-CoA-carboxylase] ligase [Planctomycetaceae bacterium]|nr:MAG: biotin--[acetyl-CoA-carboxylase] ligase [Planctomycetaceae bacterium]